MREIVQRDNFRTLPYTVTPLPKWLKMGESLGGEYIHVVDLDGALKVMA